MRLRTILKLVFFLPHFLCDSFSVMLFVSLCLSLSVAYQLAKLTELTKTYQNFLSPSLSLPLTLFPSHSLSLSLSFPLSLSPSLSLFHSLSLFLSKTISLYISLTLQKFPSYHCKSKEVFVLVCFRFKRFRILFLQALCKNSVYAIEALRR